MAEQEPVIECTAESEVTNGLVLGLAGLLLGGIGYLILVTLPKELKPSRRAKKDED